MNNAAPPRPSTLTSSLSERLRAASQALRQGSCGIEGLEVSDSCWEEWDNLARESERRQREAQQAALIRGSEWFRGKRA
ncbi:hypothetical protein [Roseateles sp.]|jgi:hypothetical protein|uniref:hypothetical protein n=1 Tax=Roseateles sp. TaxID=1971397 RepID=UPI003918FB90